MRCDETGGATTHNEHFEANLRPAPRSSGGTGVCTHSAYNKRLMKAVFIELPAFERHRKNYLDDDAFSRLQDALMDNPEAGEVMEGTGGLRKVRFADSRRAKGKRGGLRVIYYSGPADLSSGCSRCMTRTRWLICHPGNERN